MVRKDVNMTEDEKKLLQAKHRQEAVEARNRQKERKQRTRRLIQQGAILENVFPEAQIMDLDNLKMELERRLSAEVTEKH
jgi:DNA-binding protein H-NS